MEIIPYSILIIFIIIVIIMIIILSSISYNQPQESDKSIKISKKINKISNIQTIRPEFKNNCYIVNINNLSKNSSYLISGIYNNSCVSIYDNNNERLYSKIISGERNIILSSNYNTLTPLLKENKYKNVIIPLNEEMSYTVVFDYIENHSVKVYTTSYDVAFDKIPINYEKSIGLNEYDLDNYANNHLKDLEENNPKSIKLERVSISNFNKPDEWVLNREGQYVLVYVKNLYNYDINFLNGYQENIRVRKNNSEPEIQMIKLQNPYILIKNLDYVEVKKDINTEYLDLITGPNELIDRFFNGKKNRKINYTLFMNNKVLVYKI